MRKMFAGIEITHQEVSNEAYEEDHRKNKKSHPKG